MYWWAASTEPEERDVKEHKYRSIVNHVVDRHSHETQHFPCCAHKALDNEEVREKLWFDEG